MRNQKVIAIFDIGKTNKKFLLFNKELKIINRIERKFKNMIDEDGTECEDLNTIHDWIKECLTLLVSDKNFDLKGVNFSTYGATLVSLNAEGKPVAPVYNYLKSIPDNIQNDLFEKYGGKADFCRQTASPALGMLLNSGIQILWLKRTYPEIFKNVASILHLPQYLSYLFTQKIVSEYTSIGCHTFLWNYDQNVLHQWLTDENISLPKLLYSSSTFYGTVNNHDILFGIGIHDSSSSLIPYMRAFDKKFILISTGTWSINMNPFNQSPLTKEQLNNDCLNYLGVDQQAIKSSRFFLGHLHDLNVKRISDWFGCKADLCYEIKADEELIRKLLSGKKQERIFYKDLTLADFVDKSVDLSGFRNFSDAYHRLIFDLTVLNEESIRQILGDDDSINTLIVSGGFARNEIYLRLLATFFSEKEVFTSRIENTSALGAAIVIWTAMEENEIPKIDLNLKRWFPYS